MKAKGRFISFLLVANAFFAAYAVGLNSRNVELVDPSLPAFVPPVSAGPSPGPKGVDSKAAEAKGGEAKDTGKATKSGAYDSEKTKHKHEHAKDKKHSGKEAKHKSKANAELE